LICLTISAALAMTVPPTVTVYALVLVGVAAIALVVVLARQRTSDSPAPSIVPAEPEPSSALADDEILRFTREITRPASFSELQQRVAQQLPPLLGVDRAWIVARFGTRQRIILPGAASPADDRTDHVAGADRRDWTTFPLTAGGGVVGVLGLDVTGRKLSPHAVSLVRAIAPIVAHALVTADATDHLRETSILDPLTGCATRQHGLERLAIELKRSGRSSAPLAVLMIDLDHFKDINDRFGHNIGDSVLTAAGRTMLQTLRASDVRCRWGGEEFLIVLPETALDPARQVADGLLRRLIETPVHTKGGTIHISASIGLTLARPGEDDIEALIGRADRALYRAKSDGRGCVRVVLGEGRGAPAAPAAAPLPFRERRDPGRGDRRRVPGGGRRKTDVWSVAEATSITSEP
jgi:diguanylate cyclase (GGDEF)-like protein